MKKNDVASFFYYMWNAWCEEECAIAFANAECGWKHLWDKWCFACHKTSTFGASEEFFANLSEENQDMLVERATIVYNRKRRIL